MKNSTKIAIIRGILLGLSSSVLLLSLTLKIYFVNYIYNTVSLLNHYFKIYVKTNCLL